MNLNTSYYRQKIEYARMSLWAPFYTVGMVARIKGDVPPALLNKALKKLKILYPPLGSRVDMEPNGDAFLTTEGVDDFIVAVQLKNLDRDWETVFIEQEQIPFAIERGPLARFFLLKDEHSSDLVAIAPHVICDGYAMTHVMHDAVTLLNDPEKVVKQPDTHLSVAWNNVQHAFYNNLLLRGFIKIYNPIQAKQKVLMNQERYETLYHSFWSRHQNQFTNLSLTPVETMSLMKGCKQHGLSVTGALFAADYLTKVDLNLIPKSSDYFLALPVNIRKLMHQQPERLMGVYATSIEIKIPIQPNPSFWKLAYVTHTKIHKSLKNLSRVLRMLVLDELNPLLADNIIEAVSTEQLNRLPKILTRFIRLDPDSPCLTISNIGRVDLPSAGTNYPLETLFSFMPTGAGYNHSICAMTVNNQMHLALRFHQLHLDQATITKFKERIKAYLLLE